MHPTSPRNNRQDGAPKSTRELDIAIIKAVDANDLSTVVEMTDCLFFAERIDTLNINGLNALSSAAVLGHTDIARVLVLAGADVNHQYMNNDGLYLLTPLQHAVLGGHFDTVKTLVELGADPTKQETESGNTALHFATLIQDSECFLYLYAVAPAGLIIFNKEGLVPQSMASSCHYQNERRFLLPHHSPIESHMTGKVFLDKAFCLLAHVVKCDISTRDFINKYTAIFGKDRLELKANDPQIRAAHKLVIKLVDFLLLPFAQNPLQISTAESLSRQQLAWHLSYSFNDHFHLTEALQSHITQKIQGNRPSTSGDDNDDDDDDDNEPSAKKDADLAYNYVISHTQVRAFLLDTMEELRNDSSNRLDMTPDVREALLNRFFIFYLSMPTADLNLTHLLMQSPFFRQFLPRKHCCVHELLSTHPTLLTTAVPNAVESDEDWLVLTVDVAPHTRSKSQTLNFEKATWQLASDAELKKAVLDESNINAAAELCSRYARIASAKQTDDVPLSEIRQILLNFVSDNFFNEDAFANAKTILATIAIRFPADACLVLQSLIVTAMRRAQSAEAVEAIDSNPELFMLLLDYLLVEFPIESLSQRQFIQLLRTKPIGKKIEFWQYAVNQQATQIDSLLVGFDFEQSANTLSKLASYSANNRAVITEQPVEFCLLWLVRQVQRDNVVAVDTERFLLHVEQIANQASSNNDAVALDMSAISVSLAAALHLLTRLQPRYRLTPFQVGATAVRRTDASQAGSAQPSHSINNDIYTTLNKIFFHLASLDIPQAMANRPATSRATSTRNTFKGLLLALAGPPAEEKYAAFIPRVATIKKTSKDHAFNQLLDDLCDVDANHFAMAYQRFVLFLKGYDQANPSLPYQSLAQSLQIFADGKTTMMHDLLDLGFDGDVLYLLSMNISLNVFQRDEQAFLPYLLQQDVPNKRIVLGCLSDDIGNITNYVQMIVDKLVEFSEVKAKLEAKSHYLAALKPIIDKNLTAFTTALIDTYQPNQGVPAADSTKRNAARSLIIEACITQKSRLYALYHGFFPNTERSGCLKLLDDACTTTYNIDIPGPRLGQ